MRTIEMLGLKRKILTTNENIRKYDFYRSSNQIVVSRSEINISLDNITSNYEPIDEVVYNSYSLSSWINDVFNI